ncbi:MAG: hypothetical protein J5850_06120 [Clostridia bacterium]|nr:hypothetical protein [Clostridia bacterium]
MHFLTGTIIDTLASISTTELIVWSILIGSIVGTLSICYNKIIIGAFVRDLLKSDAKTKDTAMTLTQLGYNKNAFVKHELKRGAVLRKLVWEADDNIQHAADGTTYSARNKKMNIQTARFYIDESNYYKADVRYNAKGTDIFTLIIAIILFVIAAFALIKFIPYITSQFANIFN